MDSVEEKPVFYEKTIQDFAEPVIFQNKEAIKLIENEKQKALKKLRRRILYPAFIIPIFLVLLATGLYLVYRFYSKETLAEVLAYLFFLFLILIGIFFLCIFIIIFANFITKTEFKTLVQQENVLKLIEYCNYLAKTPIESISRYSKKGKLALNALMQLTSYQAGLVLYQYLCEMPETFFYIYERKPFATKSVIYRYNFKAILEFVVRKIARLQQKSFEELVTHYELEIEQANLPEIIPTGAKIVGMTLIAPRKLKQRCMISGLPLDPDFDTVVACPYCKNFARQDLLIQWLNEKGFCPICLERITILDCLKVQLEE